MIQVVRIFSVQLSTLVRFFHQVKITLARLLVTHVQKCRTLPPFLLSFISFFLPSFFTSLLLYYIVLSLAFSMFSVLRILQTCTAKWVVQNCSLAQTNLSILFLRWLCSSSVNVTGPLF
jgi:hypothetical protein